MKRVNYDALKRNGNGTFAKGNKGGPGRPPEIKADRTLPFADRHLNTRATSRYPIPTAPTNVENMTAVEHIQADVDKAMYHALDLDYTGKARVVIEVKRGLIVRHRVTLTPPKPTA